MKSAFLLISYLLTTTVAHSQVLPGTDGSNSPTGRDSTPVLSSAGHLPQLPDSSASAHLVVSPKPDTGEVSFTISPPEAAELSLMLIQRTRITPGEGGGYSAVPITPDTLALHNAPRSLLIPMGDYDLTSIGDGYKPYQGTFALYKPHTEIKIEMTSLAFLKARRAQWGTLKWISGGAALVGGGLSFLFRTRLHDSVNMYNQATSPASAFDARNSVNSNQIWYKVASSFTFLSLGSFLASWICEDIVFGY
jgi:hypothetical protein